MRINPPPPSPPAVPIIPNAPPASAVPIIPNAAAAAIPLAPPEPDMRRIMAVVGGPNYINALKEADARTGVGPLNIPCERCG